MADGDSNLDLLAAAINLTKMLDLPEMNIGLLARLHRAKRSLMVKDAAAGMAISRQLLSEIEDGKVPQASKLRAMINFYGDGFAFGLKNLGISPPKEGAE